MSFIRKHGIPFFLGVLAGGLCVGIYFNALFVNDFFAPTEFSEHGIRTQYGDTIPASAYDLYYFTVGFQDRETFLAFCHADLQTLWTTAETFTKDARSAFVRISPQDALRLRSPGMAYAKAKSDGWNPKALSSQLYYLQQKSGYVLLDEVNKRLYIYQF